MSSAFLKGIKENQPQAEITFDKFYMHKNETNLMTRKKVKKADLSLAKLNLKAIHVMQIGESFQHKYTAESAVQFAGLLNIWNYRATHKQLASSVKAVKSIKKHREVFNSVIFVAKRKTRGFNVKHFKTITYLLTGKLDFSKVNTHYLLP